MREKRKKCPVCKSSRYYCVISVKDGEYIKKSGCKKCGYLNQKRLGDAVR